MMRTNVRGYEGRLTKGIDGGQHLLEGLPHTVGQLVVRSLYCSQDFETSDGIELNPRMSRCNMYRGITDTMCEYTMTMRTSFSECNLYTRTNPCCKARYEVDGEHIAFSTYRQSAMDHL